MPGQSQFYEVVALTENSKSSCGKYCGLKGYALAATGNSKYCACDNMIPVKEREVSLERCSSPCSGNPDESCGGSVELSVSYTGYTTVDTIVDQTPDNMTTKFNKGLYPIKVYLLFAVPLTPLTCFSLLCWMLSRVYNSHNQRKVY